VNTTPDLLTVTAATPAQSAASQPSPDSWTRSATVDFFRGMGLWIVFIDHIEPNIWSHLTLWRFGFSDFAEIFIFLSGFIGLRSYERALATGDTAAVFKKLGRRMARLYVAHIASMLVSMILIAAFAERGLYLKDASIYTWMQNPARYALRMLTLLYAPSLFTLLPLYIRIAPVLVLAAIGLRRAPKLLLCVSGALWLLTQFSSFHRMLGPAALHPLAWQFLYVLGATVR
jgi:hypothetical protein